MLFRSNLLDRSFDQAVQPNRLWGADITYVRTLEGWLYVAVVLDLFSRRIVGYAMDETMSDELVARALEQAISQRRPKAGLLVHSDRGSQYSSWRYRDILYRHGVRQSMSRKGNCWDNAPVESFFKTLKAEEVTDEQYRTREEARLAIFEYIEGFYNTRRLHSTLGYQTPTEFEERYHNTITNTDKTPCHDTWECL